MSARMDTASNMKGKEKHQLDQQTATMMLIDSMAPDLLVLVTFYKEHLLLSN